MWFSAAFNDLGGQKISLDVDINVKQSLTVGHLMSCFSLGCSVFQICNSTLTALGIQHTFNINAPFERTPKGYCSLSLCSSNEISYL